MRRILQGFGRCRSVSARRAIENALKKLTQTLIEDVRKQGCRAKTVTVRLRFADFETLPRPSDALATILRAARDCLARFAITKKLRLVGGRLSGLVPVDEKYRHHAAASAARCTPSLPGR